MSGRAGKSYPKAQFSRRKAATALTMLLSGCTDERLAGFTAAGLAGSYNVTVAEAERLLSTVRQVRNQRRLLP